MTKAQEVKKALKNKIKVVSCTNGTGTAYGWVTLNIEAAKPTDCYDGRDQYGYDRICQECRNKQREIETSVYRELKAKNVKLYEYSNDGNDGTCMIVHVNLI